MSATAELDPNASNANEAGIDPSPINVDVAIIGGGPAGTTLATLLKKYRPQTSIAIFEREQFPRDHVGESLLPPIGEILDEMGCWEAIEAANFPIKIGATYRWGQSAKLWDFEFIPTENYREEARPRPRTQQSKQLSLQVDRARYDQILLERAREVGVDVRESTAVRSIECDGDRVSRMALADGRTVSARYYIDASGNAAVLRRAMGIGVDLATKLQNIAFWSYWENGEWASQFPGGATRVLIQSIGVGWIWYIPITATRTSIGLVVPSQYYKDGDRSADELYEWALQQNPLVADLIRNATRDGKTQATKDWSFIVDRMSGENWFLVGESGGFADPILSAGMTLTHVGARELAHILAEVLDNPRDERWLKESWGDTQRKRISQHIKFADFWYAANGIFTELQDYTREIARDAGMDLSSAEAFRWLATGGFTTDIPGQVGIGGLDLAGARQTMQRITNTSGNTWQISNYNRFRLRTLGAETIKVPMYVDGKVECAKCYVRGNKRLVLQGFFGILVELIKRERDLVRIMEAVTARCHADGNGINADFYQKQALQALEVMINDGWVEASLDPKRPRITLDTPVEGQIIHTNDDLNRRMAETEA